MYIETDIATTLCMLKKKTKNETDAKWTVEMNIETEGREKEREVVGEREERNERKEGREKVEWRERESE